jgi:hypothetical protein
MWKAEFVVFDVQRKTMVPSVSMLFGSRLEPRTFQIHLKAVPTRFVDWYQFPLPTSRHLKVMHEHYVTAVHAVLFAYACVVLQHLSVCLSPLSLSLLGFDLHTLMCALKWDWPAFQRWTISCLLQRAIQVLLTERNTQLGSFISCGNKGTGVSFVCSLMYSPLFYIFRAFATNIYKTCAY